MFRYAALITLLVLPLFAEEVKELTVAELKAQLEKQKILTEAWKSQAVKCQVPQFIKMIEDDAINQQNQQKVKQ